MTLLSRAGMAALAAALLSLGLSLWIGARMVVVVAAWAAWLATSGLVGKAGFVGVEFLLTLVGVVPGASLAILAGAIFGVAVGFVVSALGIMAGAMAAFWLSRSLLRPSISVLLARHARLTAVDGLMAQSGWRVVAMLRVSPVMPFSVTSYALGVSGIGLRDYVLGTMASLPPLLGYVAIGALGKAGLAAQYGGGRYIHAALLLTGAAASLGLTFYVSRLLARAFKDTGRPRAES
ncbi:MAG: VTT domain-containing protein, partial [Acidocella sp.]|nr:VTT domain-containing protein [Acidocella sp.]